MKSILCVYLLLSFAALSNTSSTDAKTISSATYPNAELSIENHSTVLKDGSYLNLTTDVALGVESLHCCSDIAVGKDMIDDFTWSVNSSGPTASCNDLLIYLDNSGNAMLDVFLINDGSTDGSGGYDLTYELSQTMFDCDEIGSNEVFLTVTDVDGNQDMCSALVTVSDFIAPLTICNEFTVASLDADGLVSVSASDVDEGSFDNCSAVSMELDISDFDCSNLGENVVELTVVDQGGNSSVCWGFVVVEDNLGPLAVCNEFTAATLDANGNLNVSASDVDAGSSDNCLLYTSPSPRDKRQSRMPSSA